MQNLFADFIRILSWLGEYILFNHIKYEPLWFKRSGDVERGVGVMCSFCGSWKLTFFSLKISKWVRLVPSLIGHTSGIRGLSWSKHRIFRPICNASLWHNAQCHPNRRIFFDFRGCQFVIGPYSRVCHDKGAIAVGDNFGKLFILGDHLHGPTNPIRIMRIVRNILEFFVYFEYMYNND